MNLNLTIQLKKVRKDTIGRGNLKCKGQEARASVTNRVATLRVVEHRLQVEWKSRPGLNQEKDTVAMLRSLETLGFSIRE